MGPHLFGNQALCPGAESGVVLFLGPCCPSPVAGGNQHRPPTCSSWSEARWWLEAPGGGSGAGCLCPQPRSRLQKELCRRAFSFQREGPAGTPRALPWGKPYPACCSESRRRAKDWKLWAGLHYESWSDRGLDLKGPQDGGVGQDRGEAPL